MSGKCPYKPKADRGHDFMKVVSLQIDCPWRIQPFKQAINVTSVAH